MAAPEVNARGETRVRDAAEEDGATSTSAPAVSPAVKRRKLEEEVDGESRMVNSPCVEVQLRGSGGNVPSETETSVIDRNSLAGEQCQSPISEGNQCDASTSCCSSNGFDEKVNGRYLEEDNVAETGASARLYSCSTRNGTWGSEGMDSGGGEGEVEASEAAESCGRTTVTEAELEDFFTVAEKDIRNKTFECSTKYNFDFAKEEALDGRYEWVKLKP